ncbi:zinc-binding dehydrogenase [Novosphingobium sp. CECT 9465]|uniref:zinc-binding dehydrogenase n=1 Tax=Novosphingobium sp. CECT 9465 TaxID=2829794 RepID=UPI001E32B12D|nr:zinc-binding dehydrogenase [Novosphingobium sp. CECT 9465]CAH0495283.1 Putative alcohol dehydrogenase D [Novosphingobium sp. CECT 9465]
MKITASVLDSIGQSGPYARTMPLRVTEVELDTPGPDELLVKIEAAGLCHSDLSVINGDRPRPMPMAIGHEAVATVLEPGSGAGGFFAAGDRVVLSFLPLCGHCQACMSGEGYMCANGAAANGAGVLLGGDTRLSECGHRVHHHLGASAFASHAVIDRRSAVKIPADVPVEIAALFGCAVLTGVGAVLNTALLRPGESVVVYGLGGVGLAALMGAIAGGATSVVAIDPVPEKRALALELGAVAALDPAEGETAIIAGLGGTRPDLVVETVGKASVLALAYGLARRGGRIVTVGLPNPSDMLSIPAVSLVGDGKTLMGSYMGSSIPSRDIPRYIALWRAGRLPVDRLLTSVSPLSDINALFDRLQSGEAIRQIVIP